MTIVDERPFQGRHMKWSFSQASRPGLTERALQARHATKSPTAACMSFAIAVGRLPIHLLYQHLPLRLLPHPTWLGKRSCFARGLLRFALVAQPFLGQREKYPIAEFAALRM